MRKEDRIRQQPQKERETASDKPQPRQTEQAKGQPQPKEPQHKPGTALPIPD